MAKSSAEKLAAALRANLKRRKPPKPTSHQEPPPEPVSKPGQKPSKTED